MVESDSDEHDKECVDNNNGNGTDTEATEGGIETDIDSEVANIDLESIEEVYATTKAMGNADCEVHLYASNSVLLHD